MPRPIILILVGIRGCGKSTLGLLGLSGLNFKYVDAEHVVSSTTNQPDHVYIEANSLESYQKLQTQLIIPLIREETQNLCIVLPSLVIENDALCKYLESQPYVISIERDESKILEICSSVETPSFPNPIQPTGLHVNLVHPNIHSQTHTHVHANPGSSGFHGHNHAAHIADDTLRDQISKLSVRYRQLARFNYFNIESSLESINNKLITESNLETLILKEAQLDFTSFLRNITGINPLSSFASYVNIDAQNRYSCSLQFDFPSKLMPDDSYFNLSESTTGCDAITIRLDLVKLVNKEGIFNVETILLKLVATLRRKSTLALVLSIVNTKEEIFSLRRSLPIVASIYNNDSVSSNASPSTTNSSTGGLNTTPNSGNSTDLSSNLSSNFQSTNLDRNLSDLQFYFRFLAMGLKMAIEYIVLDLHICIRPISPQEPSEIIIADRNVTESAILSVKRFLKKSGNSKIVGKYHLENDEFWTSESGALRILKFADSELRLRALVLTGVAKDLSSTLDNWNFLRIAILEYPDILVLTYNVGQLGRLSKILNRYLTPVFTYNTHDSDGLGINSDKLLLTDVHRALQQSFQIPIQSFYMVGHGTSFGSLMPSIQNFLYFKIGAIHTYNPFDTDQAIDVANIVSSDNFGGCWVLQPFLKNVFYLADVVTDHARAIGVINLLVSNRSLLNPNQVTKTIGDNTDWIVVTELLNTSLSPINLLNNNLTALVVGSCDVSYAAVYALILLGYKHILIYDDVESSSIALKNQLSRSIKSPNSCTLHVLSETEFNKVILPANSSDPTTIILGTTQHYKVANLPIEWLRNSTGGVIIDTTVDMLNSLIIKAANTIDGWISINGLNYLATQAAIQFECMVKKPVPRPLILGLCLQEYLKFLN